MVQNPREFSHIADVGAEAVLIAGGGRAILLQLAHPAIARAIAEHSDFDADPSRRLRRTLAYVYAQTYGTDAQRAAAVAAVDRAHAGVVGGVGAGGAGFGAGGAGVGAGGAGIPYSADDPELQLWVAATLYDSALDVYERVYGPLPDEVADQIYRDYAVLGTALRMHPELWPADRRAFRAYFDGVVAGLSVSAEARAQARRLLFPARGAPWMKAAAPLGRLVTAGLLPASIRQEFGMRWSPRLQRRFDRWMAVIRVVYPRLPACLRHWPRDRSLAEVARMA